MSRLNIAEKRLPQDGRIKLKVAGREIDVRVSIIPMIHGEGIVLRLLDKERMKFDLSERRHARTVLKPFSELISPAARHHSGHRPDRLAARRTTLYRALMHIKDPTRPRSSPPKTRSNITLDGINQIQVHSEDRADVRHGLRSILRHDPDMILIGEIRDLETAAKRHPGVADRPPGLQHAAHQRRGGAFTRLVDMGVEPFLVSSTVEGVMAQRLVRLLCPHCKQAYRPTADDLPHDFPQPAPDELFRPVGCRVCRETGYMGRSGVYELLKTDSTVRHMCVERASSGDILQYGLKMGMKTLRQSGYEKCRQGATSLEEVLRVTKGTSL